MSTPRVTVAVPTYNGQAFIEEAIASVLAQVFDDFELVVVDDGSDDATLAIVSRFHDPRLRVEAHPVRLGLVENWNRCLAAATGDYVTIFHQDDVMAPHNLASKVALLDQHPSVAFVHSAVQQIGPDGSLLADEWYAPLAADEAGIHDGQRFLARLFAGENVVCCPTVVLRRSALLEHGGFDLHLPFTADWEMWMRLSLFHDAAYLAERLVSYRRHPSAETERFRGPRGLEQCFLAKHRLLEKFGDRLPLDEWRRQLTDQYAAETLRVAAAQAAHGRWAEVRDLVALTRRISGHDSRGERNDLEWTADLLRQALDRAAESWAAASERVRLRCEELEGRQHDLTARLTAATAHAASFQDRCAELDRAAQRAEGRAAAAEARARELKACRHRAEQLHATVDALHASASWRVTAPLRFLFRILTGRAA